MTVSVQRDKLLELLKDFYILTRMRIVIFDESYVKILSYPYNESDFCEYIKSNQEAMSRCMQSDRQAFQTCKDTKRLHIYKCHAGLVEVVSPIKIQNMVLGYIMFGQIVDKSMKNTEKNNVLEKCSKYGLDADKLSEKFDRLVFKNTEQITAASKILESCACYLWISNLVKIREESLFLKIDRYVSNNLQKELSPDFLCKTFDISRNKLYEISNRYFGMGIAEYIRKKRIEQAKKLLEENEDKICEISTKVGISDYNYFSKMFKKETGFSPRNYLKRL